MCGISGLWAQPGRHSTDELRAITAKMAERLAHRGPDGQGVWLDEPCGVALGHRRLAIQDLSESGAQPMISANGRFVISYNGEIYNFQALREQLQDSGSTFKGHSDTEVLIESIAHWGVPEALRRINGMFAFALWDREHRRLTLARDRVGKKNLYYGFHGGVLLFGSELKALMEYPSFEKAVDPGSLTLLLRYSWIASPYCIFKNTQKLEAASYIEFDSPQHYAASSSVPYWSARECMETGRNDSWYEDREEAVNELERILLEATKQRMIADVEVGSLLSGGLDSSIVTAMMSNMSSTPIKTFSIGFHEDTHDEAPYARAISKYLHTDHTEFYVTPEETLSVIPSLAQMYDEPIGDASQIPTSIISRIAAGQVKVVLSGDGGDELLAGYTRYFRTLRRWRTLGAYPLGMRYLLKALLDGYLQLEWKAKNAGGNGACRSRKMGTRLKLSRRIHATSAIDLFCKFNLRYNDVGGAIFQEYEPPNCLADGSDYSDLSSDLRAMQYIDYIGYLPDDILVKVDRASMAYSLEVRSPMLDFKLLEHVSRMPAKWIASNGEGKLPLKTILDRYIPEHLTKRKKMGFGVPISKWLQGPLKEWANDLLSPQAINRQGIFHTEWIDKIWAQHLNGCVNHDKVLWSLLMFQDWHRSRIESMD